MEKIDIFNSLNKTLTNDYGSNLTISNIIIILVSSLILSLLINYTYRKAFLAFYIKEALLLL